MSDEILETQRVGLGSALALVQALAPLPGELPELWFVTAGAQPMERAAEILATTQAPMWGFARVITKEERGLRTRLVDVSAACDAVEIDALAREIATPDWEDELALRGETRFARRLHRVSIADVAVASPSDALRTKPENARRARTTALELRDAGLLDTLDTATSRARGTGSWRSGDRRRRRGSQLPRRHDRDGRLSGDRQRSLVQPRPARHRLRRNDHSMRRGRDRLRRWRRRRRYRGWARSVPT